MPIVVVGTEKNFAALRPRLFAGATISNKAAGDVADAVRKANPDVNLDKLTPGTVLTVPDAPKVRVRGELSVDELTTEGLKALGEHGKATLAQVAETAKAREAEIRKERTRVLKSLDAISTGSTSARAAPKETPPAKELTAARTALEADDAAAKDRAASLKQAQEEWTAGLDALLQRIG
jgi:hypothetical protein